MASASNPDLARAFAEIAREINSPTDLDDTLQTIVEAAARSLPDIDHVGITLAHSDGRMETKAATDQLVWDLDKLQYDLHEGPCVHAIEAGPVVKVEHVESEERWPRFMPRAIERGLRSQLGVQLYVEEETLGGLNMYSTSADTIGDETLLMAEVFAAHAALTLGRAQREDHLHNAISTRQLIGQATGIIMERYDLTEARAFDYLIRVSSHSNIKLRDVAREVVAGLEKPGD
jgi:GAF domain-containing protein